MNLNCRKHLRDYVEQVEVNRKLNMNNTARGVFDGSRIEI